MSFHHDNSSSGAGLLFLLPWWVAIPLGVTWLVYLALQQPTSEELARWHAEAQRGVEAWAQSAYQVPASTVSCRVQGSESDAIYHCNVRVSTEPAQVIAVDWDARNNLGESCAD